MRGFKLSCFANGNACYLGVMVSRLDIPNLHQGFFTVLKQINYDGWFTIESFDSIIPTIARLCSIWRMLAESPEELATQGLLSLKQVVAEIG